MSPADQYFLKHEEPIRSCLQFLRAHILKQDSSIRESWQYGMHFIIMAKSGFAICGYTEKQGNLT